MNRKTSPPLAVNLTNEELLKLYLSLPKRERDERFIDTARAAEITGLTRRTIQLWIEVGAVRAIHVGKKYEIEVGSLMHRLNLWLENTTH